MEEVLYKSSLVCTRLRIPLFLNADSVEKIDTFKNQVEKRALAIKEEVSAALGPGFKKSLPS